MISAVRPVADCGWVLVWIEWAFSLGNALDGIVVVGRAAFGAVAINCAMLTARGITRCCWTGALCWGTLGASGSAGCGVLGGIMQTSLGFICREGKRLFASKGQFSKILFIRNYLFWGLVVLEAQKARRG